MRGSREVVGRSSAAESSRKPRTGMSSPCTLVTCDSPCAYTFDMPEEKCATRTIAARETKPTMPELFIFAAPEKATHSTKLRRRTRNCLAQKNVTKVLVSMLPADVVTAAVDGAAELAKQSNADKHLHTCCICTDNPVQVRLDPCGHKAFCKKCIRRMENSACRFRCPLCRAAIDGVYDTITNKRQQKDYFGKFQTALPEVLASRRLVSIRRR